VILIGDVDVMTRPNIIFDDDRKMTHNAATPTNKATVADNDDWVSYTFLTVNHSCRQCNMRTDHGVIANSDVSLIEYRCLRETHHAAISE
jgi:hypothetical protein